jgi:hypothetical protein
MSEPIASKEEVIDAINGGKKAQSCPVHGEEPPAINVGGLLMAKHDLDGRWCVACLLELAKKHGCHRLA